MKRFAKCFFSSSLPVIALAALGFAGGAPLALRVSAVAQTTVPAPDQGAPPTKTEPAGQARKLPKKKDAGKQTGQTTPVLSPGVAVATPSPTPSCLTAEEKVSPPEVVLCIDSFKGTKFSQHITMNSIIERGNTITVPIAGLKEWADDKEHKDHDLHALRLFLAGHLLPEDEPSGIQVDQGYINFKLTTLSKDADERKAWTELLSEAQHQGGKVSISVGLPKELQPFRSVAFISLRVYPVYTPYVVIGLVLLLIALIVLAWRSDLLRDTSRGKPPKPSTAPFSLGRMQMAWWFYLVVAAYVYICLVTKDVNGLSATVLGLIGISAGTGLAAAFVDKQKLTDQENQKMSLQAEQGVVQARISQLRQANPATGSTEAIELAEKQKRLAEITQLLSKYPSIPVMPVSRGLIDVLRDGEGVSFHRFQIVVWTIVLGLVFVRSVILQLIMPDFDATLLGLMGISSGTYIGFKFPEK